MGATRNFLAAAWITANRSSTSRKCCQYQVEALLISPKLIRGFLQLNLGGVEYFQQRFKALVIIEQMVQAGND